MPGCSHRPGEGSNIMGNLQASEFANMGIDLETAITWQLRNNHYPPVPSSMVPVAIAAIHACNEDDPERLITSPYEHCRYGFQVPAHAIIEAYHLDAWCHNDNEDY